MNARNAHADTAPPASMARRSAAVLLDALVWLAVAGWVVAKGVVDWAGAEPGSTASDDALGIMTIGLALTGALVVTQWLLHARNGWTIGRLAVGIRTLDVESRRPIGVARVFVRTVVVAAGFAVALLGGLLVLASPFFDRTRRNRGWHDRAASDEVLDLRESVQMAAQLPPRRSRPPVTEAAPAPRGPTTVPEWAQVPSLATTTDRPAPAAALVLAPVTPRRSSPDLDTRSIPVVGGVLSPGLAPELEMTRPVNVRVDVVPEPPAQPEIAVAEFELSDGRRVSIERVALVGRNPASEAAHVQLVRVADPTRSVSKTHLQIGVDPGGVWVADRGSTNGTVVTLPDGGQIACRADQQVRLRVGSTVVFGDCSMRLVRTPGAVPAA